MRPANRRAQSGFSFIEILVVMGIISVLVSMVVVVIPMIQERGNQTKSRDNVSSLIKMMSDRVTSKGVHGWPPYDGKNFVLSLVARGVLDRRNKQNLEILFSPGDGKFSLESIDDNRYKDVNKTALKSGTDFHELTSYAGRRNGPGSEYRVTADQMKMGTLVICDDDDGPVHHSNGIVVGYSNASVRFLEWDEFDMMKPEDPDNPEPFLGDDASHDELMKMYGK